MLVLQYTPDMSVKVGLHMKRFSSQGFALPTVLIASVVMMVILATSVAGTVATRTSIKAQQYDQLSSVAAESGLAMATACIKSGVTTWSNPLRPGGTCAGLASNCTNADCYVMQSDGVRSTFEVSAPAVAGNSTTIEAKGTTQLVRTSNQQVWRTYNQVFRKQEVTTGSQGMQWKQLSSYGQNVCALSYTNQLFCWGNNASGQVGDGTTTARTSPTEVLAGAIPTNATVKSISVGTSFACALASNNQLYCWGSNANGQLGDNSTTNRLAPTLVAQGDRTAGVTFQEVKAGGSHTCAIGSNGAGYCWGLNTNGQLGNNSTTQRLVPTSIAQGTIPTGAAIKQIALGDAHTCATASNNTMYCWGNNTDNQVGNNSTTQRLVPTSVLAGSIPTGVYASSIYAEGSHTCMIGTNNLAYCWGNNASGQAGINSGVVRRSTPGQVSVSGMPAGTTFQALGLGAQHTCALASNSLTYCWGLNSSYQVGDGTTNNRIAPTRSTQISVTAAQLDGGDGFTCLVTTNNATYCLGSNASGTFGDGTTNNSATLVALPMVPISATSPVANVSIQPGASHSCALASNMRAYCFGRNNTYQLGDGTTIDRTQIVEVLKGAIPESAVIRQLSTSGSHVCAVSSENKPYCWGNNDLGKLGDGTTTSRSSPVAVSQGAMPSGFTVRQISAGLVTTCAIASDNKAYCWGANATNNQVGDGTSVDRSTPTAVALGEMPTGATVRQIATGSVHTCAIASDFKAYCWGNNANSQLGNGTTTNSSTPVAVAQGAIPTGLSILHIAVSDSASCAVASDYKAYCWGGNTNGALGDGSTTTRAMPVAVAQGAMPTGVGVSRVSMIGAHTCLLLVNGTVYCMGSNTYGQQGNGTTTSSSTPVAVSTGAIPAGVTIINVQSSESSTCAVASNNQSYCWGYNNYGQLGDGSTTTRTTPVAIQGLPAYPQPFRLVRYF